MMETCCSRFTAAEGGARLAAAAGEKNILAVEYSSFISTRLVHEDAYKIRGRLSSGRQRSIFVCRASRVAYAAYELQIMTDLKVVQGLSWDGADWAEELEEKEVLVCTSEVLKKILEAQVLGMPQVNVLIIDSCHLVCSDDNLQFIMKTYKQCPTESKPRILALTYPLFAPPTKESDINPENDTKTVENDTENSENDTKTDGNDTTTVVNDTEIVENVTEIVVNDTEIVENVTEIVENYTEIVENIVKKDLCEEIGVNENLDDFEMYEKLEWKIEELEKELCCEMDLAEDIDGGKRLSASVSKPKELIIEHQGRLTDESLPESYVELETYMRDVVNDAVEFITEHRYDPTEIYGEDMYEEFKNIPDPAIEPKYIFKQFMYVLEQLGPYAADKAAFSLLAKLEKLKIKVPYERHFLLLCLCTSVFVKIRCYADLIFSKYTSDWEKIKTFSTPKVMRFAEILQKFQPPESMKTPSENTVKMLNDIDKCDFVTLGNRIEDRVNTYEANLKDLDDFSNKCENNTDCDVIVCEERGSNSKNTSENPQILLNACDSSQINSESTDKMTISAENKTISAENMTISAENKTISAENKTNSAENKCDSGQKPFGFSRRSGGRVRGRGRSQRSNTARVQQILQNPDALCGIVFMKEPLMAKIMFMVIVDMSRAHRGLSYLCAQYCASEAAADQRECQRQGKKQEEVLKKFRMHECNLLLATSALEEGIDLPRCNLVLRWDVPQSYRSYGLCRGRARAARAACGVLCCGGGDAGGASDQLLHDLAAYREIDQIISRKCGCGIQDEPPQSEEDQADVFNLIVKPYTPQEVLEKDLMNQIEPNVEGNKDSFDGKNERGKTESQEAIGTAKINETSTSQSISIVKESKTNARNNMDYFIGESNTANNENRCTDDSNTVNNENSCMDVTNGSENESKSIIKHKNDEDNCNKDIDVKIYTEKDENTPDTKNGMNAIEKIQKIDHQNELEDNIEKLNDLKISEDSAKDKINIDFNTQIVNSDTKLDTQIKNSELFDSIKDNLRTDNLYCNKCNNMKTSVSVECPCVKVENVSSGVKKCDTRIEKDCKKIADSEIASVDLNSAIALINRYCGKLPSDTFTRLAPQWWTEQVHLPAGMAFVCTLRLPLNCPVKYNIVGHPMPTRVLARRMVALQACRILHKSGELDNQLMPIGKENFKAAELETPNPVPDTDAGDARPGTTKRRQYYFKRTAHAFTDCQPIIDSTDTDIESNIVNQDDGKKKGKRNMLYAIVSKLWCALPERYNTRGRRLHAPQNASQAIGILMAREEPDDLQIPAFPVYTRSGEVRVCVEYVPDADARMSPRRGRLVRRFMRFVFASVLRVRRRGMRLHSDAAANNYYVVPTVKTTREDGTTKIDIDWAFLELIYQHTEDKKHSELEKPLLWQQDEEEEEEPVKKVEKEKDKEGKAKKIANPLLKPDETFQFDPEKYREAVVTPWYRNQDQPQFFLVAEICWNLSPDSAFPSATHTSFRNYYSNKYGVVLTQPNQPLLDVDHTSARLNLLTPRYVNRKGVALPVSSERTRRAKRDRLDQKQILVPELCRVHPFAAPLWFATVALPCVLYRINALLIADEIRRAVAIDVGLGIPKIDETTCPGFQWPPLDFGWSLAEVLSADSEKNDKKKDEDDKKETKDKHTAHKDTIDKDTSERETTDKGESIDNQISKEKTINDILAEKEDAESGFEIGTWSNDMASSLPDSMEYDEFMEPLPSNLTFCTSASGGTNWSEPIEKPKTQFNPRRFSMADSDCSYMSSDFDTDDSDLNSDSDEDTENSGFWSKNPMGVRIEYKTAHEAEAVDVEKKKKASPQPQCDPADDAKDRRAYHKFIADGSAPKEYIEKFRSSVDQHKQDLITNGNLIKSGQAIGDILPQTREHRTHTLTQPRDKVVQQLFPYGQEALSIGNDGQISIESIERNKRVLLKELKKSMSEDEIKKLQCFSMVDVDIDSPEYVNEKVANVGFDTKDSYVDKINKCDESKEFKPYYQEGRVHGKEFDFDYQPDLEGHPGPSPSVILQALTMSNANDGINLERLETIGDSFLKFAITAYLYCAHPAVHEGKLSHMRSKQVSNLNLYRLGRSKRLGARMIASKFEPHDNWLPPCHRAPHTHAPGKGDSQEPSSNNPDAPVDSSGCFIPYNLITQHSIPDKSIADCVEALIGAYLLECGPRGALLFMSWLGIKVLPRHTVPLTKHPRATEAQHNDKPTPQASPKHSSHDVSDSDSCSSDDDDDEDDDDGTWSQDEDVPARDWSWQGRVPGSLRPYKLPNGEWVQPVFGELKAPPSPLLRYIADPEGELAQMLSGYEELETTLQYRFNDRSLLLQALTHASHQKNRLTDCYQRLEFLGDAILDYLITRHLYEDPRRHSPGALTDLRSALVNNTIFATLAARHGFHKYFRHMSPGLNEVLTKYVKIQEENGHSISEEHYLIQEDELEQAEDVEVPKALGDLFESVAGAIFLDSGMSLGAVWKSYVNLMGAELEAFSAAAPKSPVRELLEAEPDTAKFGKPERLADGRRVRVCVEVFGRGAFKGVGRNYRIAKGTAARAALRHLAGLHR